MGSERVENEVGSASGDLWDALANLWDLPSTIEVRTGCIVVLPTA